MGCVPDQSGWVDFKSFTSEHPPAEMLNPSALFIQSEGSREDIRLEVIGRGEHLGRQTSRVSAVVPDWDSRVTWMEILQCRPEATTSS